MELKYRGSKIPEFVTNPESYADGLKRVQGEIEINQEMKSDDQYQEANSISSTMELLNQLTRLNDNFEYYLDQTLPGRD